MSKEKKQQIAEGVFMTKEKFNEGGNLYYSIKIELRLFKNLDFIVDLTNSTNIEILGEKGLVKEVVVPFLQEVEIARLLLKKGWKLITKFKFTLSYPDFESQKKHLELPQKQLHDLIEKNEKLKFLDPSRISIDPLCSYVNKQKLTFLDYEFLPTPKSIGTDEQKMMELFECLVHWRSVDEVFGAASSPDTVDFLYKEISPAKIRKGNLKNVWLVTAIMCLAERPKLIKRLIKMIDVNDFGIY